MRGLGVIVLIVSDMEILFRPLLEIHSYKRLQCSGLFSFLAIPLLMGNVMINIMNMININVMITATGTATGTGGGNNNNNNNNNGGTGTGGGTGGGTGTGNNNNNNNNNGGGDLLSF